ncbi:MAG: Lrp/AsnC family transcriptional regulator [Acidipropionibacterium sp.]|nr:Lrp/AsnC family transcriptional regulator [Acidipropionibacterium sp.]
MSHESELDEVDLRLVHALQIEPRASWKGLSPVVGADPSALSRRWQRIRDEGLGWVTGLPGGQNESLALIELECVPGTLDAVSASLVLDPEVLTLDYTVGARELLVTARCSNLAQLSDFMLNRFGRLEGVRSSRSHLVTETVTDARNWRLRSLSSAEQRRVPRPAPPRLRAARQVPEELRRAVMKELSHDGRAPASGIAERHGVAAQRVTDAIATLRASGELVLRTDVARSATPWPVYTWYFMQLRSSHIDMARQTLPRIPEIRMATLCASQFNLIIAAWLPDLADVHGFEARLARVLPGAVVVDRSAVLRIRKHLGHLLDEQGRATGETVLVPLS